MCTLLPTLCALQQRLDRPPAKATARLKVEMLHRLKNFPLGCAASPLTWSVIDTLFHGGHRFFALPRDGVVTAASSG